MIAALFPAAHMMIHAGRLEAALQLGAQQEMIDP
jgi:hypothetical protein